MALARPWRLLIAAIVVALVIVAGFYEYTALSYRDLPSADVRGDSVR